MNFLRNSSFKAATLENVLLFYAREVIWNSSPEIMNAHYNEIKQNEETKQAPN